MAQPRSRWVDRRVLTSGLAVLLVLVAAITYARWEPDGTDANPALREYAAGQRPAAPPIGGETLAGEQLSLVDLRGDVVVVNVWASWCPPCRAEMADLEAVYQATAHDGVRFVGVNIRDDRDRAERFLEGRVTYPSIYDPASKYALLFDDPPAPVGPPATFVVDRSGNLAAALYRVTDEAELMEIVTQVAAEEHRGHE